MLVFRLGCVFAAIGLLAAAVRLTIEEGGATYLSPYGWSIMAVAIAIAMGAMSIGVAITQKRYAMSLILFAMLLIAEVWSLSNTADRLMSKAEAAQAPAREAQKRLDRAAGRVTQAQNALAEASKPSARLTVAMSAKSRVDATVAAKSAERGCASNCRKLLEAQVTSATVEITSARSDQERRIAGARHDLNTARAALNSMPAIASATSTADRLMVSPWAYDLTKAAAGSLVLNGFASVLLCFAGHGWREAAKPAKQPEPIAANDTMPPLLQPVHDVTQHASKFAVERMSRKTKQRTPLVVILAHYERWCFAQLLQPLPEAQITGELCKMFREHGYHGEEIDGEPYLIGVAVRHSTSVTVAA
jgi:hypothetical protein